MDILPRYSSRLGGTAKFCLAVFAPTGEEAVSEYVWISRFAGPFRGHAPLTALTGEILR